MKAVFCILIAVLMILPLAACAKEPVTATDSASSLSPKSNEKTTDIASDKPTKMSSALPTETDSSSQKTDSKSDKTDAGESDKPTSLPGAGDLYSLNFNEGNYVLASNQRGNTLHLYALDFYDQNLESCEIWSLILRGNGIINVSGIKYREDTVYDNVIAVTCSGGFAGLYKFPSKKELWSVDSCGGNPHSIEILPNGAVVTADSDGEIRIYDTSVNGSAGLCGTYALSGAHAVLWDPNRNVLWALGGNLVSYEFQPNKAKGGTLKEKKTYQLPEGYRSGHELSVDMTNSDVMFATTNVGVLRFNKKTESFSFVEGPLNHTGCKGYGNNSLGNTVYCYPNKGVGTDWASVTFHDWCTDTIYFYDAKTKKLSAFRSESYAFYKVFSFCGQYLQQKNK